MEITAKSLPDCKKGKEENPAVPLCTTVKDHNNYFLQKNVDTSFEHCLQSQILEEPCPSILGSEQVVCLPTVCPRFASDLQSKAVPALVRVGLQFDMFGIQATTLLEWQRAGKALAVSPVVVGLKEIERAKAKLGYAIHKGEVFKKNSAAMFNLCYQATTSIYKQNNYLQGKIEDFSCFLK